MKDPQIDELREKILSILLEPQLCIQTGKDYPKGYLNGSYNWYADSLVNLFFSQLELAKIDSNETRSIVTGVAKRLKQARELGRKYIRISDLEYSIRYELTKQKEELQK